MNTARVPSSSARRSPARGHHLLSVTPMLQASSLYWLDFLLRYRSGSATPRFCQPLHPRLGAPGARLRQLMRRASFAAAAMSLAVTCGADRGHADEVDIVVEAFAIGG